MMVINFWNAYEKYCTDAKIDPSSQSTAALWGVSRATISAWKKNGTTPRGDVLAKMAYYFGVSIEMVLGIDGVTDHNCATMTLFNSLDSDSQKAAILFMEFLSEKEKARTTAGG